MIASVGESGRVEIVPPAKAFLAAMDCANLDAAKCALKMLPNVQIEEGTNDNSGFTVIMQNWSKYQVDSTSYERLKRLRCKRREDKNKRRRDKNTPPISGSSAEEVITHFNEVCRKTLTLTPERRDLVEKRLAAGRTVAEMKTAISHFAQDDWADRHKFMDLVYVIGVRNKVDNLDKWLNYQPGSNGGPTWMSQ